MPSPLSSVLAAGAKAELAPEIEGAAGLEATLARLVRAGAEAWPRVQIEPAVVIQHVARHLEGPGAVASLDALHATDVYLAAACASGNELAMAELLRAYFDDLRAAIARVQGGSGATADEVEQALREKLFVGDGEGPPKIAQYAGRGPLAGWLRVVAVRTALTLRRRASAGTPPAREEDALLDLASPDDDPEVFQMRAQHATEFREAFHEALRALSAEDRNVLRLHLLDGLSIDEIGALFRVHRATAARWIVRCRARVAEETRRRLAEKLNLEGPELESLVATMLSKIDVSIQRVLGEIKEAKEG